MVKTTSPYSLVSENGQSIDLPEALLQWLDNRKVEEVECVVSDIVGIGRGKTMPARKFFRAQRMFLPSSIFYQTITGNYAEVDIKNAWTESDLVLVPDYGTARAVPWTSDVTMQVIHDLETQDEQPVGFAPRNVLKRVIKLYHDKGWKPVVAPELEFYLTKRNICLLYTSPSPRDQRGSRMPSSA